MDPMSTVAYKERYHFHWPDWLIFAIMLAISTMAGIWHYRTTRKATTDDYLMGGKKLGLFPISASLVSGWISGVTILGTPPEIYNFGTQYWITVFAIFLAGAITAEIYVPVFVKLQLHSVYEYLEIRFDPRVRFLLSFIFVVDVVLYLAIVIYVPALALNQVSDLDVHFIAVIVTTVCVFYTAMGGMRAVVLSDALQVGTMVAAVLVVAVMGTIQMGGVAEVWRRSDRAGRIEFLNFSLSPYERHSVLTVTFGSCLYTAGYIACNQTIVQRYLTLPTLRKAKWAIYNFSFGLSAFISMCCWAGLVLVAWWTPPRCDPRTMDLINADDQLLPAYVMEIAGHIHGIPGLFVSGVFGAALSSLAICMNSTAVVILEDFVRGLCGMRPTDRCSTIFVKLLVVALGIVSLALVFVIENLGGIMVLTASLAAVAAGVSFGVFSLGMLVPWSNSTGVLVGGAAGFLVAGWACAGSNWAIGHGYLVPRKLPVEYEHCPNVTQRFFDEFDFPDETLVPGFYRLSFHYVAPLGLIVVLIVGTIISFLTGPTDPASVHRDLFSPIIHRWLPSPPPDLRIPELDPETRQSLLLAKMKEKEEAGNSTNPEI